jgi:hypothetical protein
MLSRLTGRSTVEVPVLLDIERTAESFHCHAVPEGIEIRPGDSVQVHDAPTHVDFGECYTRPTRATVTRGSFLDWAWTRLTAPFEILELYEVGFQPKE